MAEPKPGQLAEDVYYRLHAVAQQLDHIRDEAADLSADLRNRLHALMLQRRAVARLTAGARSGLNINLAVDSRQRRAALKRPRHQPIGRSNAALRASEQNS